MKVEENILISFLIEASSSGREEISIPGLRTEYFNLHICCKL
jgi:hypothetical protein